MRDSKSYDKAKDTAIYYSEEDDSEIEMQGSALDSGKSKKDATAGSKYDIE